jgi:hypothetical protein
VDAHVVCKQLGYARVSSASDSFDLLTFFQNKLFVEEHFSTIGEKLNESDCRHAKLKLSEL